MRKSLLLTLAAAAAVVGCSKDQLASNDLQNEGKGGIRFETHLGGATKGAAKESFVAGDRFEVIGYSATTAFATDFKIPADAKLLFTGDATYFPMERAVVSANQVGSDLLWEYRPMIYWPAVGNASFVAFSPAATAQNKITAAKVTATPADPAYQIEFEVIGGSATETEADLAAARLKNVDQIDLLNAQNLNIAAAPVAGVGLDFKHALTKVRFSVKGAQSKGILRIVSVTLSNVVNKGKLALMYDQTNAATATYLGGWTPDAVSKVFFPVSLNSVNAASVGAGKVVPMVDNHEALLMIPQDLANVTVTVVYAHSMDGGITWQKYTSGDGQRKISLATAGVSHWKPNMSINYVMDINPGSPVSFVPELKDWDVAEEQYVPKFSVDNTAQAFTSIELEVGDVVTSVGNSTWITMEDSSVDPVVAKDLSTAYTVTAKANHVLRVVANATAANRTETIKITRANADPKLARVITIELAQAL